MILGTFHFMQILMVLFILALIGYYVNVGIKYFMKNSEAENPAEEEHSQEINSEEHLVSQPTNKVRPKRNWKVIFGVIIILFIGLTLPFHYLPQHGKILMKANLTFKNTIVTNSDIERIVDQFNNANFMQQMQMRQDPFIKTLLDSGVMFEYGASN